MAAAPHSLTIDIHAHVVPSGYVDAVLQGSVAGMRVEDNPQGADILVVADGGPCGPAGQRLALVDDYHDCQARTKWMDAAGVDIQVISPVQFMFHYWSPTREAAAVTRVVNDGIAAMVRQRPDRFVGMGTVPLQDVGAAVAELDRLHEALGMRAVEIGTHIAGVQLDSPALDPFYARAEALGTLILVHPYAPIIEDRLDAYRLYNLAGNPFETTIAMSRIFFGGVLERFPALKLCFCHGGGAVPYILGRLDRGHAVTAACRARSARPPREYAGRVYYDGLTHSKAALQFLIAEVGEGQVLLGSDHPFDVGEGEPVRQVESLALSAEAKRKILGATAATLLGLR